MSPKKAKKNAIPKSTPASHTPAFNGDAGVLWIDPNLNRKLAGPGGNRGEHTTSAADLLKLAEIALKKTASH